MATSLSVTRNYQLNPTLIQTGLDVERGSPQAAPTFSETDSFSSGTSDYQADKLYYGTFSISASSTDTYDIEDTSLSDALGNALEMAELREIWIYNQGESAAQVLEIGGTMMSVILGGNTEVVNVGPGGIFVLSNPRNGFATAAGTADTITITNNDSTTYRYDLCFVGTSA